MGWGYKLPCSPRKIVVLDKRGRCKMLNIFIYIDRVWGGGEDSRYRNQRQRKAAPELSPDRAIKRKFRKYKRRSPVKAECKNRGGEGGLEKGWTCRSVPSCRTVKKQKCKNF